MALYHRLSMFVAYNVKTVKSEYSCTIIVTIVQNKYNINKNM